MSAWGVICQTAHFMTGRSLLDQTSDMNTGESEPRFPGTKSSTAPDRERERSGFRRVIAERGLCGLANDTKWNEFISAMRTREGWVPSYRCKCVDGRFSAWDTEWWYHLPFPFIRVEWLDIAYMEVIREHRLPPVDHLVDHSPWFEELLGRIGLEYRKGATTIRIFGYSPRCLALFDE